MGNWPRLALANLLRRGMSRRLALRGMGPLALLPLVLPAAPVAAAVDERDDETRGLTQGEARRRGPTGPEGRRGSRGPVGPTGPRGTSGPSGLRGFVGPTGARGPSGSRGFVGIAGPTGPRGQRGFVGASGARGFPGPTGPRGAAGPGGARGPAGAAGVPGPVGPAGPAGLAVRGATGPAGSTGPNGSAAPGPTGPTGVAGPTGLAGVIQAPVFRQAQQVLTSGMGRTAAASCLVGERLLGGGFAVDVSGVNVRGSVPQDRGASQFRWFVTYDNPDGVIGVIVIHAICQPA